MKRFIPLLALASLVICSPITSSSAYADDAGVVTIPPMIDAAPDDAPVITPDATAPAPSSPVITPDSDDGTLAKAMWSAIQSKDWFLAIGAGLALFIHLMRWLLKKKWPSFEKDHWGWFLAAGMAGLVAVSTAWLAGKDMASTHTLVGGVKILVAAIATYVSAKKLAPGTTPPTIA
jgi:hypothetical protein